MAVKKGARVAPKGVFILSSVCVALAGCYTSKAPGVYKCSDTKRGCPSGYECDPSSWTCVEEGTRKDMSLDRSSPDRDFDLTASDRGVDLSLDRATDRSLEVGADKGPDKGADIQLKPDKLLPDSTLHDQWVSPDGGVTIAWVKVTAGTFSMGSPKGEKCQGSDEPHHKVTLTRNFLIQNTEVTQAQFKAILGYTPSVFWGCGSNCPVENINWFEAANYTNALSKKAGLAPCYSCSGSGTNVTCKEATAYAGKAIYTCPGYRLPTEAEWEYAYRAGTITAFYNGKISHCTSAPDPNADKIGWYGSNSSSSTQPVGKKAPNNWGLHDMAGNVFEWCHDWYGSYPSATATDPVGTSGTSRVFRGGKYYSWASDLRAAWRNATPPTSGGAVYGFRPVKTTN